MRKSGARLDRREFLMRVGRSAGGAAMLRTMAALGIGSSLAGCGSSSAASAPGAAPPTGGGAEPSPRPGDWPPNAGAGQSVLILGAGIAGMTAAFELAKLGYDCTILEARDAAGGRNRTLRAGDLVEETDSTQRVAFDASDELYFNAGPSRIPHHHELLLGYCREFGVALETFVNDNHAARLHDPLSFGGTPELARRVRSDLHGQLAELLSSAIDQGALDQALDAADRDRVLDMLTTFGDLGAGRRYGGSTRAGFPGQEDVGSRRRGETLAPLDLADLVSSGFWTERLSFTSGLDQQATMLQPVGGMDRIARAFEQRVAGDLVLNARVTAIRKTVSGVRVDYELLGSATSIEADHCIVTLPATVLTEIPGDYSPAHKAEIDAFRYTSAVRIAFQSRRFWEQEHSIYGGISWTNQDITQIWYPSHGFGSRDGIVLGAYAFGGPPGDRLTALTPGQRTATAITEASAVHAAFTTEAVNGVSVAWAKVPFQRGAWGVSTPSVLLTPDDRLFYAGEHLSMLQGWQEGAILSAYRAIDGIVASATG